MRTALFCIIAFTLCAAALAADTPARRLPPPALRLHLARDGWGDASLENAEKVFDSAGKQLLIHFPGAPLSPIHLQPRGGPITLFRRAADGSYIVKLDTSDRHWAQYSFQFGHELCHIMSGFDDNNTGNLWLEESLCELSSLYVLRRMSEEWAVHPPYANWKNFAPHLADYAQKRINDHALPTGTTLAQWYLDNADALRKDPTDRRRDTIVAVALLPIFEKEPSHWAAVSTLNKNKPHQPQSLPQRLQNWHDQTPPEHQPFIRAIAERFDITLTTATSP